MQYGRQNIESVRKRNGTWEEENESEDEGGGPHGVTENYKKSNDIDKMNKIQNGGLGNTVIARSKDLILVPGPDTHQNNKNHVENLKSGGDLVDVGNEKEVNFLA